MHSIYDTRCVSLCPMGEAPGYSVGYMKTTPTGTVYIDKNFGDVKDPVYDIICYGKDGETKPFELHDPESMIEDMEMISFTVFHDDVKEVLKYIHRTEYTELKVGFGYVTFTF
jgi:hypothetical protein